MIVKEHITPKQAEQLSKEEFYSLFSNLTDRRHWYRYHNTKMTVGKMIGILGEDLKGIDRIGCSYRVKVEDKEFKSVRICDSLWEAVVYKIKNRRDAKQNK